MCLGHTHLTRDLRLFKSQSPSINVFCLYNYHYIFPNVCVLGVINQGAKQASFVDVHGFVEKVVCWWWDEAYTKVHCFFLSRIDSGFLRRPLPTDRFRNTGFTFYSYYILAREMDFHSLIHTKSLILLSVSCVAF